MNYDYKRLLWIILSFAATPYQDNDVTLMIEGTANDTPPVLAVGSRQDAITAIREHCGEDIDLHDIHPHPSLNRMVCLWVDKRRWSRTRHVYKRAALTTRRRHGEQDITDRKHAWARDHPTIATALAHIDWKDIRSITGATAWGEQVLYRLKHRAFSNCDSTRGLPGCPISDCLHQHITTAHTFWTFAVCGRASTLAQRKRVGLITFDTMYEMPCRIVGRWEWSRPYKQYGEGDACIGNQEKTIVHSEPLLYYMGVSAARI
ncbi:LOW QUALITY PROTEIN: reverse transcriptase [Phytophthora megakarya]|uniref:Reverse transcriptase n=1 Tax=Phytophthora megakarya TaxID=4795 RepID=A0A225WY02_9STRA|nr:LOW QUALITY PROTEIN: reverse transcriptase [Phytophthora megakarya]